MQSALTCSLNGAMVNGTCACDPGWTGSTCGQLKLCPVPSEMPGFWSDKLSSWGASPLYDRQKAVAGNETALFVSVMAGGCPLSSWETNSYVAKVGGPSFEGPLSLVQDAETGPETHNPEALLHDGNVSIFVYNGCGNARFKRCSNQTVDPWFPTSPPCTDLAGTNLRRLTRPAEAPAGSGWEAMFNVYFVLSDPKARPDWWCELHNSNPSPLLLDDGSAMMAVTSHCARSGRELYGHEHVLVGRAPSIAGPFVVDVEAGPVFGVVQSHDAGGDAFLFRNERGFHLLAHGMNIYDIQSGRHAWSADGIRWESSPGLAGEAYSPLVHHTSGLPTLLASRQRPKLILDSRGKPEFLINGVQRVQDLPSGTSVAHARAASLLIQLRNRGSCFRSCFQVLG